MIKRKGKKVKIPMFFAKKGWWGEKGMVRISFWKYLTLVQDHTTKVRWVKCKKGL